MRKTAAVSRFTLALFSLTACSGMNPATKGVDSARSPRRAFPVLPFELASRADLVSRCLSVAGTEDCDTCEVEKIEPVHNSSGTISSVATYRYGMRIEGKMSTCGYARVLLTQAPAAEKLRPVWAGFSELPSRWPAKYFGTKFGSLLQIPLRSAGTGHLQSDALFLLEKGAWRRLDTASYVHDLEKVLPDEAKPKKPSDEAGLVNGIYPNFYDLNVMSAVWLAKDPHCCPSGGEVRADLGIKDGKLVALRARYVPPAQVSKRELHPWEIVGCDFQRNSSDPGTTAPAGGPAPNVGQLLRRFLEADQRGEFIEPNPWLDGAVLCPGFLSEPESVFVIRDYLVKSQRIEHGLAEFEVVYEVVGELKSKDRGWLTFIPESSLRTEHFTAVNTPFGWRFKSFPWKMVGIAAAEEWSQKRDWAPGSRDAFRRAVSPR